MDKEQKELEPKADIEDFAPQKLGKKKALNPSERERIWVTKSIKSRLEELASFSGLNQETILGDVLDYYEIGTGEEPQVVLPELEMSVGVLNIELARLNYILETLEAASDTLPLVERDMRPIA